MEYMEYVGYETRGANTYFYPLVKIDGEVIGIHCVKSFDVASTRNFKHVVNELSDVILRRFDDESNYGLSFYACGYNGAAQTDFERHYLDEYGIEVF